MPLFFRESRRGRGQGVLKWKASVDAPRRAKLHPSSRSNKHKAAIEELRMKPSRALLPAVPKRQSSDGLPSPVSLLGAGRVDPFATYPVQLKSNKHLDLVDHFMFVAPSLNSKPHQRACFSPLFQRLRRSMFEAAQDDSVAFGTILAFSSADRSTLQDENEPVEAIKYSTQSLQLLRERLSQPSLATTDGTIAAVAIQIAYTAFFVDCDTLDTQLNALEKLVELRGGIEAIERHNPKLGLLVNFVDYITPISSLISRRRFHTRSSNPSDITLSPLALDPPPGLELLASFDIYIEFMQICLELKRATNSLRSGDADTLSSIGTKFRFKLQSLIAIGTSLVAWGRRARVLICAYLSALIYLKAISQLKNGGGEVSFVQNLLGLGYSRVETPFKSYARVLLRELLRGDSWNENHMVSCLAPLMRVGPSMNAQSWLEATERLQHMYEEISGHPIESFFKAQTDPREREIDACMALFSFLNLR